MAEPDDKMRAAFEAWASDQLGLDAPRYKDGYKDDTMTAAWWGWQAALAGYGDDAAFSGWKMGRFVRFSGVA